jgi:hypothetical protein
VRPFQRGLLISQEDKRNGGNARYDGTQKEIDTLVFHFEKMSEHPAGSDLIFYPEDGADESAEGITLTVKKWRAAQGLPEFKGE